MTRDQLIESLQNALKCKGAYIRVDDEYCLLIEVEADDVLRHMRSFLNTKEMAELIVDGLDAKDRGQPESEPKSESKAESDQPKPPSMVLGASGGEVVIEIKETPHTLAIHL